MKKPTLVLTLVIAISSWVVTEGVSAPPQKPARDRQSREGNPENRGLPGDAVSLRMDGNLLIIDGTGYSDYVEIRDEPYLMESGSIVVRVYRDRARKHLLLKRVYPRMDYRIDEIHFDGKRGNDYFWTVDIDVPITALGGPGEDYLEGGSATDYMIGGPGGNVILGRGDTDYLEGGPDQDFLFGNDGDDIMDGHAGNDFLFGGRGVDRLMGGEGADYLDGMKDGCVDILKGEPGIDTFVGYYTRWFFSGLAPFTDSVPEDDFIDFKVGVDRETKRVYEYFGY